MEIIQRIISGKVEGRERGKGAVIRSMDGTYRTDRGRLRIMGNAEAKELICMTHGHELRWGNAGGREEVDRMELSEGVEMGQL